MNVWTFLSYDILLMYHIALLPVNTTDQRFTSESNV